MTEPYLHVTLEGSEELVRGFILGVSAAVEIGPVVFASEAGLREAGLARRFVRLLHLSPSQTEALIPQALLEILERSIRSDGSHIGIELKRADKILGARFNFKFEVYNRDEADQIRELLKVERPGIEVRDYHEKELVEPDAKGSEIYTPMHEYTFSGSGEVLGAVGSVCFLHEALASHTMAEVEPIDLKLE